MTIESFSFGIGYGNDNWNASHLVSDVEMTIESRLIWCQMWERQLKVSHLVSDVGMTIESFLFGVRCGNDN